MHKKGHTDFVSMSDYTDQSTSLLETVMGVAYRPDSDNTQEQRYLNDDFLEAYLSKTRGGDISTWRDAADKIAYHESGPYQRMSPTASQDGSGIARGMFQFESASTGGSGSLETAIQRYRNVANKLGKELDPEIMNATSADQLNPDQQYALFYSNLIEGPAKLADFATGKLPLVDLWLQGHKKVEAEGNRSSFMESIKDANKRGIQYVEPRYELEPTTNIPYKSFID